MATLDTGTEVIVQLRDCDIDLSKVALARSLLGSVVPEMKLGKVDEVAFAYVASLIPGTIWDKAQTSADEDRIICSEISRLLIRCSLGVSSAAVIDGYVVPRLRKIIEIEDFTDVPEARERLEELLGWDRIAELKLLPLSLCHIDVNHRNVSFSLYFHRMSYKAS